jgi:hypothetical protein
MLPKKCGTCGWYDHGQGDEGWCEIWLQAKDVDNEPCIEWELADRFDEVSDESC